MFLCIVEVRGNNEDSTFDCSVQVNLSHGLQLLQYLGRDFLRSGVLVRSLDLYFDEGHAILLCDMIDII